MGRLIPDLLRAVADGWDKAAGRDPVDRHAAEAMAMLDDGQGVTIRPRSPEAVQGYYQAEVARLMAANVELRHALDEATERPDEVVVTGPELDDDLVIRLGLDLREARREIERLEPVVDAARTYAELYAGERAKYCVEPSARALVDAVRALDGQPLLSAVTPAAEGTA